MILQITVAILLLPAGWVYYGGFFSLIKRQRQGPGVFADIISDQGVVRERLAFKNRFVRVFIFALFSLAVRIQQNGSVKKAIASFLRILVTEGPGGLRGRVVATVPGGSLSVAEDPSIRLNKIPALPLGVTRKILVADFRVPQADVSAGERATLGIIKDLCGLGYDVIFLPIDLKASPEYEAELCKVGAKVITKKSGFKHPENFLSQHGSEFGTFYLIRIEIAERLLPIARRIAPLATVIFHAPDLYFVREMREAELANKDSLRRKALLTRQRELAVMSKADRVVVVSSAEADILKQEIPDLPVSVFPVLYAPVIENAPGFEVRNHIFFLGGFAHTPNVGAVQWFVAEVWPHVRQALPEVEFHIVGSDVPASISKLGKTPGVKVLGFLKDLTPYLKQWKVGVAPLQYGAGIKGKVAMTMGAGIPCVMTDVGAEGMGINSGEQALVENEPQQFASAVVSLYREQLLWQRLAKGGQELVKKQFGDEANRRSLTFVLNQSAALPAELFSEYCQKAGPLSLPSPAANEVVDVSIIVPVYNKWNLTQACLTSIALTSVDSEVSYEVILADDGSSDETLQAAQYFPGLQVVRTPQNLGFLRNCNHAARVARGNHILLLNNDTIVLPGWLKSLYAAMMKDSSIAIVGSKLIYPDESIQEAGAGLLSNAEGINFGRKVYISTQETPVKRWAPFFNFSKEVDYISGASILVRRSFWDDVGGFDEGYEKAYCEDSDLAMTARAKGLRVVYEPASEVVHLEHQTYADHADGSSQQLQNKNKVSLHSKWQSVFESQHLPPGSSWFQVATKAERNTPSWVKTRRESGKMNVLYFSPFPSHPSSHGNQSTIQQFAKRFQAMGHKVHFALLKSGMYSSNDEKEMRAAWDSLDIIPTNQSLGSNGKDIPFDGWYEDGLGERIRLLCAKYDIDVVFCSYVFQSKMLEYIPEYMLKVVDTHDKMGNRYEMLRKNGQPLEFFSCTPEEEGAYLRRADVVVARRAEEARYFDEVSGKSSAIVIPHIEEPKFISRHFAELKNVGIVASANRINLAIVRECLEALDKEISGGKSPFTVHVAGQVKELARALPVEERQIFDRPWVKMHGFVADIGQFYSKMDLLVSPVTMGTGINVKTVQAMAFGMPLMTTVCGIKGIETSEPRHNLIDLQSLASDLMVLAKHPEALNGLATLSRDRYMKFYDESLIGMIQLFQHEKLKK